MNLGLTGKVAMVAASSKGIGRACAQLLADEGCQVSICGRNEETLEQTSAEIGDMVRSYVVDVSSAEDLAWWVDQTRQDIGPPSILVTNTGGPPAGNWMELTDEQWLGGVNNTLLNVVRLTRIVVPEMKAAGWGRIVHITSLVAKEPAKLIPISSTLRSGLNALTKLQGLDLAASGITVNAVLPGHTLTDRQTHLLEVTAQKENITVEEALARQTASMPAGRMANPEEIAAAVVFLCSVQASYINGTSLLVDGAYTKAF